MQVRKRDGSLQAWDLEKVKAAIAKAFGGSMETPPANFRETIDELAGQVSVAFSHPDMTHDDTAIEDIEKIQDVVERVLMLGNYEDVAKSYILYRDERRRERARRTGHKPDPDAIADYIHPAKYAKYDPKLQRREVFLETSHRSRDMHIRRFPHLESMITDLWEYVDSKKVLPSMRSMQFGGKAIEMQNPRMYNCAFTLMDRPRAFQEAFYLLLCGCGAGFSVQWQHVAKLPALGRINPSKVRHHRVNDSIEGWADSVGALFDSYVEGYYVEFDYTAVRPEGAQLRTSGGKAPGHIPLRKLHDKLRSLWGKAQGRQFRPIEVHDTMCHIAEAVLAGGIRRSSLMSLFSLDDGEMLYAKTPENFQWEGLNAQRAMANNSAVFLRGAVTKDQFLRVMNLNHTSHSGDPGFFFTDDLNYGTNPCGEIGLNPVFDSSMLDFVNDAGLDPDIEDLKIAEEKLIWGFTGWSFCNLCEINASKLKTVEDFLNAARAAATIGTLQASYTDFPYLGPITERIVRNEALLGVGITGIQDCPEIALDPEAQFKAAQLVNSVNESVAKSLKIRRAARTTTVKPSGTASLELGCIGSGIHPHHARRYLRRITANPLEPVAQFFKSKNPHMVETKPNGDLCLTFCVEAPANVETVKTQSEMKFLEMVLSTYENWVRTGTNRYTSSPGLTHNVSATVSFHPNNWNALIEEVWAQRHRIAAMSFAQIFLDKGVPFIPREEIINEVDETKWRMIIENYQKVDYSKMVETEDGTAVLMESACAGGACEVARVDQANASDGSILMFESDLENIDTSAGRFAMKLMPQSTPLNLIAIPVFIENIAPGDVIMEHTKGWSRRFRVVQGMKLTATGQKYVVVVPLRLEESAESRK